MRLIKINIFFVLLLTGGVSASQAASITSEQYIKHYGTLSNAYNRLVEDKELTVAFLGGSITHMKGWRDLVCAELQSRYPNVKFRFINAGIPSLGSLPDAFRFQKDILDKGKIDLLFVESAVNDNVNGTPGKIQRRALEGIVRHALKSNPYMDIVMMAFVDQDKIEDYRAGKIPDEVRVHQEIAQRYHMPFINLAKEITDRIDHGEFSWAKDFKSIHPSPFGQKLYFNTIMTLIGDDFKKLKKPRPKKLGIPMDILNYVHGHYLNIDHASQLEGFRVKENWSPNDTIPTREGFVHVPVLEGTNSGDEFHLRFKDSMIGIGVLSGPDTGTIEFMVDGKSYPPVDLYTQWSQMLYLPWFKVLADDLNPGEHTVKVKISNQHNPRSTGHTVRIVDFLEN